MNSYLLSVRKIIFFVFLAFLANTLLAKTVTSVQGGDWTDANTWDKGVPVAGDDVIVVSDVFNSYTVSINSSIATTMNSITIKDNGELDFTDGGSITTGNLSINDGTLYMKSGWTGTFTSTGDFTNSSSGTFMLSGGGTVDMGDDVSDKFETSGKFYWKGSQINVAGYARFLAGTLYIYNSGLTMNVANVGSRNDAHDNLYISQNFTVDFKGSSYSFDVIIKNGNTGAGKEANIEKLTVTGSDGSATISFQNAAGTAHDYEATLADGDKLPDIVSDIGSANTLNFESTSGTRITDTVISVTLTSGSFDLSGLIQLIATGNFDSQTSLDLTIDGLLTVEGTLSLNGSSNNIIGDGMVSAATYSIGTGEVYGVQPANGHKAAGSTWTGGTSTDWFNASNWGKKVPGNNTIVYVSNDYTGTYKPAINSTADAREVELEGSGITLDVQSQGDLTVHETGNSGKDGELILGTGTGLTVEGGGAVTVDVKTNIDGGNLTINPGGSVTSDTVLNTTNADLVVASGSSGSGSLICGGTPNATVQRYVADNAWHLVTPVTDNGNTKDYYLGAPNRSWLAAFKESADDYYYITNADSSLARGTGFSYWISSGQGPQTLEYTGKLAGADVTVLLTKANNGWNLIGNPFPSQLDWSSVDYSGSNITGTAYIWDNSQDGYLYSASGSGEVPNPNVGTIPNDKIPMGQGFFVQAANTGNFTIPASARVHTTESFIKKSSDVNNPNRFIRIDVDGGYYGNTVFVGFPAYGTAGFDIPGDATKLFSSSDHIQFYAEGNGNKLCIDANAPLSEDSTQVVPLGVVQATGKTYTMKFTDLSHLPDVAITLEDLKTGAKQDIRTNPVYSFTASSGDAPKRFLLHFSKGTINGIGEQPAATSGIQIYSYGRKVYLRSADDLNLKAGMVYVYDMMGRKLLEKKIVSTGLMDFAVDAKHTYVVVKVVGQGMIKTKKVFIE